VDFVVIYQDLVLGEGDVYRPDMIRTFAALVDLLEGIGDAFHANVIRQITHMIQEYLDE